MRLRLFLLLLLCAVPALARAGVDVRVRGLDDAEEDNVYAQITLLDYARRTDAARAQYDPAEVQRLFDQGPQDIRAALQPYGWYSPAIRSELKGAPSDWTATYTIDPGPPTNISRLDIELAGEGRDDAVLRRIVEHPRLHAGRRIRAQAYENLKARLLQAAQGEGYLDARLTRHELRIDLDARTAEVLLTLDTGPRWYIGDITIEQDGQLDDRLLRRYLRIAPGQPFDAGKLLATQFALGDLDYFKLVEVEPQRDKAGPDRRIPIVIRTTPKLPQLYKFGLGYGTDTGARALGSVEFRRLNREGHKLHITLRPSQFISTAIAEYRIPWGTQPGDAFSFTGQGLRQNFQGIRENLWSVGAAYGRQLGVGQRRFYLNYVNDDYTLPTQPATTSVLLTPGFTASRTDIDDPIYPRRGWFFSIDVHGGSRRLLSDTSFVEGLLQLRGVYPLARRLRLLARAQEGAVFANGFSTLPPSQRFFAGGDESVRGYSYQSLAPRNAQGAILGGRYLSTGSLELDYDFYKNYGMAVFGDVGGADDVPNVLLHYGAGLGFRYRAPFGAIAIDLAHPFDRGASPVRLHVGVRVGL